MYHPPLSEGEELIEDFFIEKNMKYKSQQKIHGLKNDTKTFRIADFYLPKYDVYLEFLGNWREENGKIEYKKKIGIYETNKIPCIYIWPDNLGSLNWIFNERLSATLLKYKQHKTLFFLEAKKAIKENYIYILILIILAIGLNQSITTLLVIILILGIIFGEYISVTRRHERIKKRHKIN